MAQLRLSAGMAVLVLLGTSAVAHAQQVKKPAQPAAPASSFTARETPTAPADPLAPPSVRKTIVWDAAKWGFKLDVDQPANRATRLRDAEVGAFYRVTPSIRVGGAVGLADRPGVPSAPAKPADDQTAPRVKLETALRF